MKPFSTADPGTPEHLDNPDADPETRYLRMKEKAADLTMDMLPRLYEKFLNAPAKESVLIFEALADRSGFHKDAPAQTSGPGVQILNISGPDIAGMLNGLKTITSTGVTES